jgi:hypothetical protein
MTRDGARGQGAALDDRNAPGIEGDGRASRLFHRRAGRASTASAIVVSLRPHGEVGAVVRFDDARYWPAGGLCARAGGGCNGAGAG